MEQPLDFLSLSWLAWTNHPKSLSGIAPWLHAQPIDVGSPKSVFAQTGVKRAMSSPLSWPLCEAFGCCFHANARPRTAAAHLTLTSGHGINARVGVHTNTRAHTELHNCTQSNIIMLLTCALAKSYAYSRRGIIACSILQCRHAHCTHTHRSH